MVPFPRERSRDQDDDSLLGRRSVNGDIQPGTAPTRGANLRLDAGVEDTEDGPGREPVSRVERSRVRTTLVAGAVTLFSVCAQAQGPSLSDVMARAAAYVAAFDKDLSSIVAEERYVQTWHRP